MKNNFGWSVLSGLVHNVISLCLFRTIFFTAVMVAFVDPCRAQGQDASQIMEEAARNVEKYRKGTASISFQTDDGRPIADAEVDIVQTSQDFLFGNLVFPIVGVLGQYEDIEVYRPELFKSRFKDVFNMAIFPFYWSRYERTPGQPLWHRLPPVIEWCRLNGVIPKGHPLAWVETGGTPAWLYDMPVDLTEDLLKSRIISAVKGFQGQIDIWDVVNEPTHTITWREVMQEPYGTRYTAIPIERIADWVEKCYRWAHEANPEAELIINDYEQIHSEFIMNTRERFYELVAELQERGTPLHGIGLQAHAKEYWYSPQEFWETLDYYAELGLPIHITEFICQSSGNEIKGDFKEGTWTLDAQAEFALQTYRLSFGHPSVVSLNWWGLSDRYIWSERPGGGLIDENYEPKPVYTQLRQLIKEEWMTTTSAQTDENGSIDFRGFYGDYKISLRTDDDAVHIFQIDLNKNEDNRWKFTINQAPKD